MHTETQNWERTLCESDLSEQLKNAYAITIRWYLSYCQRLQCGISCDSARLFVDKAKRNRPHVPERAVEQWKTALNWFFRHLKKPDDASLREGSSEERLLVTPGANKTMRLKTGEPVWRMKMLTVLRRRQMSYRTETTYVGWVLRFARFTGRDDLENFEASAINHFLNHLARDLGVSAGTQRQALNALVFLYREVFQRDLGDFAEYRKAYARKRVPVVLSYDELNDLFKATAEPYCLMARLQYGAGLRVSELMGLRVKDLDFDHGLLTVRAGKGDKDRVTQLPKLLEVALRRQVEVSRELFEQDRAAGVPGVWLPESLARKYQRAGESWPWQWLWPMKQLSADPRNPDIRRRHHTLPGVYQRALHQGATQAKITKRVTSHALRHSYATHLLDQGANVRAVQELLGHNNLETTRRYLHISAESDSRSVRSPLERMAC